MPGDLGQNSGFLSASVSLLGTGSDNIASFFSLVHFGAGCRSLVTHVCILHSSLFLGFVVTSDVNSNSHSHAVLSFLTILSEYCQDNHCLEAQLPSFACSSWHVHQDRPRQKSVGNIFYPIFKPELQREEGQDATLGACFLH